MDEARRHELMWKKITALQDERGALRTQLATVTTERDEMQAKVERYEKALDVIIESAANDGYCPFGCDAPMIAKEARKDK